MGFLLMCIAAALIGSGLGAGNPALWQTGCVVGLVSGLVLLRQSSRHAAECQARKGGGQR